MHSGLLSAMDVLALTTALSRLLPASVSAECYHEPIVVWPKKGTTPKEDQRTFCDDNAFQKHQANTKPARSQLSEYQRDPERRVELKDSYVLEIGIDENLKFEIFAGKNSWHKRLCLNFDANYFLSGEKLDLLWDKIGYKTCKIVLFLPLAHSKNLAQTGPETKKENLAENCIATLNYLSSVLFYAFGEHDFYVYFASNTTEKQCEKRIRELWQPIQFVGGPNANAAFAVLKRQIASKLVTSKNHAKPTKRTDLREPGILGVDTAVALGILGGFTLSLCFGSAFMYIYMRRVTKIEELNAANAAPKSDKTASLQSVPKARPVWVKRIVRDEDRTTYDVTSIPYSSLVDQSTYH